MGLASRQLTLASVEAGAHSSTLILDRWLATVLGVMKSFAPISFDGKALGEHMQNFSDEDFDNL